MAQQENNTLSVAVIGAGMAGLALAHALINKNIDVKVFEQTPTLSNIGGGFMIYPQGIRILKKLGLKDLVDKLYTDIRFYEIYDRHEKLMLHEELSQFYQECGHPMIPMSRTRLQQGLAKALPEGVLHLDHHCTKVEENNEKITAYFSNDTSVEADIIIGADGINSVTRNYIDDTIKPSYAGICFWGGILKNDHPITVPKKTLFNILTRGKSAWVTPLAGGENMWYLTCRMPEEELQDKAHALEQLKELTLGWSHWVDEILSAPLDENSFAVPVYEIPNLTKWSRGRACVVGDAAHAFGPVIGQGYSLAMVDSYILAECLDNNNEAPEKGLKQYEKIRSNIAATFHEIESKQQATKVTHDTAMIEHRAHFYETHTGFELLQPIINLINPDAFAEQIKKSKKQP